MKTWEKHENLIHLYTQGDQVQADIVRRMTVEQKYEWVERMDRQLMKQKANGRVSSKGNVRR